MVGRRRNHSGVRWPPFFVKNNFSQKMVAVYKYSRILTELVGIQVKAGNNAVMRCLPGVTAAIHKKYQKGAALGKLTGRMGTVTSSSWVYVEVQTGQGIGWIEYRNIMYPSGFLDKINISQLALRAFNLTGASEAQKEMDDLVAIQQRIFWELLIAGRVIEKIQENGKAVPQTAIDLYQQLLNNFNERQLWIVNNSERVTTFDKLKPYLKVAFPITNLYFWIFDEVTKNKNKNLGAVQVSAGAIITIILVAVIIGGVAVYYVTNKKKASEVDFKQLPTLMKLLEGADEETTRQIKEEVQQVANNSFEEGKNSGEGFFTTIGKEAKAALFWVAGGLLVVNILPKLISPKK